MNCARPDMWEPRVSNHPWLPGIGVEVVWNADLPIQNSRYGAFLLVFPAHRESVRIAVIGFWVGGDTARNKWLRCLLDEGKAGRHQTRRLRKLMNQDVALA